MSVIKLPKHSQIAYVSKSRFVQRMKLYPQCNHHRPLHWKRKKIPSRNAPKQRIRINIDNVRKFYCLFSSLLCREKKKFNLEKLSHNLSLLNNENCARGKIFLIQCLYFKYTFFSKYHLLRPPQSNNNNDGGPISSSLHVLQNIHLPIVSYRLNCVCFLINYQNIN